MWYAAASQSSAAVYMFFFVLGSIALISCVHTLLNLSGCRMALESAEPAFAGQEIVIPLEANNQSRARRYGLRVSVYEPGAEGRGLKRTGSDNRFTRRLLQSMQGVVPSGLAFIHGLEPNAAERAEIRFIATGRGSHVVTRLKLSSSYPLGFFKAEQSVSVEQRYLVYPAPSGREELPSSRQATAAEREGARREGDDFAGVRAYQLGESQRHVDWKAVARGQPLLVKQFSAEQDDRLSLEWESLPGLDTEARLSQLALWVIKAERSQRIYGLTIPGVNILPGRGDAHYHHCLQVLAVHPPGTETAS